MHSEITVGEKFVSLTDLYEAEKASCVAKCH